MNTVQSVSDLRMDFLPSDEEAVGDVSVRGELKIEHRQLQTAGVKCKLVS